MQMGGRDCALTPFFRAVRSVPLAERQDGGLGPAGSALFKGRACPLLGLSKNLKARAGKEILRGRDVPGLVKRTIC